MLRLHSNYQFKHSVSTENLPSEAIPGETLSVTDMILRQEFNVPVSQRSASMSYGSQGSPLIPRLNCDIFDAIDYSRRALRDKLSRIEDNKRRKESDGREEAQLVNSTTENVKNDGIQ